MNTNDIAQRVAQVHLEKTAGTQAYYRWGTQRSGPPQQELWLHVRVPGDGRYISMNTINNTVYDLENAYTKFSKALKNAKVGHKGQAFLINGDRLEIALRVDQAHNTGLSLEDAINNALNAARIKASR